MTLIALTLFCFSFLLQKVFGATCQRFQEPVLLKARDISTKAEPAKVNLKLTCRYPEEVPATVTRFSLDQLLIRADKAERCTLNFNGRRYRMGDMLLDNSPSIFTPEFTQRAKELNNQVIPVELHLHFVPAPMPQTLDANYFLYSAEEDPKTAEKTDFAPPRSRLINITNPPSRLTLPVLRGATTNLTSSRLMDTLQLASNRAVHTRDALKKIVRNPEGFPTIIGHATELRQLPRFHLLDNLHLNLVGNVPTASPKPLNRRMESLSMKGAAAPPSSPFAADGEDLAGITLVALLYAEQRKRPTFPPTMRIPSRIGESKHIVMKSLSRSRAPLTAVDGFIQNPSHIDLMDAMIPSYVFQLPCKESAGKKELYIVSQEPFEVSNEMHSSMRASGALSLSQGAVIKAQRSPVYVSTLR